MATQSNVRPARLLLVEDDATIAEMYSLAMRIRGHRVTTAEDGVRALELMREGQFELVLLDLIMPRLDGFGVLHELRENPLPYSPRLVVLTNLSEPPVLARARGLGADHILLKSNTTPTMLSDLVGEWLSLGG